MAGEFWLSDGQWSRLQPLLPNKPRGVPRIDDRRVISGIVHVLQSGCRWKDAPAIYGPPKTLATFAGQPRACGAPCSRRWRRQAAHRPRC